MIEMTTAAAHTYPSLPGLTAILRRLLDSAWCKVLCGVVLPLVCLYFDPIVFVNGRDPSLSGIRLAAWAFIGISMLSLLASMAIRKGDPLVLAALGGVIFTAGIAAMVLGALMLPYSILGLIILIGILGFSPFLVGALYLRAGQRVLAEAKSKAGDKSVLWITWLAPIVVIASSALFQVGINSAFNRMIADIKASSAEQVAAVVDKSAWLLPVFDKNKLILTWGDASDQEKENLDIAYQRLTGRDISQDYNILTD